MATWASDLSPKEIGARVKRGREHTGATLTATAEKAGIHPNTLSKIESGKSRPTTPTLEQIAAALGQTLEGLLGTTPARAPEDHSVIAFLEEFRSRSPGSFEGWSPAMWDRYQALSVRMGTSNDHAALHFAGQVKREFRAIQQLLDLFDAHEADAIVATLNQEHERLRASRPTFPDARLEGGHGLAPPHISVAPQFAGVV